MVMTHFTYKNGFIICVILVVMLTVHMYMDEFVFPKKKPATEFYQPPGGAYEILNVFSLKDRNVLVNSSVMNAILLKHCNWSHSTHHSINATACLPLLNLTTNATELQKNLSISTIVSKIRNERKEKQEKERKRKETLLGKYISKNFTLVTAYWDLGTFRKGQALTFSTKLYKTWAIAFKYMLNPLVVYTDSLDFKNLMQTIRSDLSFCTKIIFVNRTKIAAFQRVDKIKEIYAQQGYPKYYPNTVNPAYAAAQNAKFNVVAETYRGGLFNTSYYGWIDVGYFRDLVNTKEFYVMVVPPDLDVNRLAYNKAVDHNAAADPISVFKNNLYWVGGGMFIGVGKVIDAYETFYLKAVDYFLDLKVSNSDQQVIYAIYTTKGRQALNPPIEIQPYTPKPPGNPWFYLGFLCRKVVKIF